MKTLELNSMGLSPLADDELRAIDGGAWPKWLKGVTWIGVANEVIDHWEEIKRGFSKGWHIADKK